MVKTFTRLFILCLCSYASLAASQVSVEPSSLDAVVNENTMFTYNLVLSNKGATDVDVYWQIAKGNDFPTVWKTTMCDTKLCYNENIDVIDTRRPNKLDANSTAVFQIYFNPSGLKASSTLQLKLYSDKEMKNLLFETSPNATVTADAAVSSFNLRQPDDLLLYPNPADQFYFIKNDAVISRVSLYNVLGKEIRSENHSRGASHDISDLNKGLYFLKLMDSKNKVIKTIRLNKR